MFKSQIKKWGAGQGLRLPKEVLKMAHLRVGDNVEIAVGNAEILIRKAMKPKYSLREMLKRIPKGYRADEIDFGAPRGKERL